MKELIYNLFEDIRRNQKIGMWAWLMQRLTGVLLTLYLFAHITVISTSHRGVEAFDSLSRSIQTPAWLALDVALLIGILFHGFNGIRIVAVEFADMARAQKAWLYAMGAIGLMVAILGTIGIVVKMTGHG